MDPGNADQRVTLAQSEVLVGLEHSRIEPVARVVYPVELLNLRQIRLAQPDDARAVAGEHTLRVAKGHLVVRPVRLQAVRALEDAFQARTEMGVEPPRQETAQALEQLRHRRSMLGEGKQRGHG